MNPSGRNVISFSLLYHCKRTFTRSKRARYNTIPRMLLPIYCPQTKLREGNVFTPVCHSVCKGGGLCVSGSGRYASGSRGCTPPPRSHTPSWTHIPLDTPSPNTTPFHTGHATPWTHTTPWTSPSGHTSGTHTLPPDDQHAGSTHPTGMLSGFLKQFYVELR